MNFKKNSLPKAIKVGKKYVGEGHPNFIIAEIGNNHNGSLDLAKKTIEAAAQAGADAVKFQKRDLQEVFTQELLSKPQTHSRTLGTTYGEYRSKLELSGEQLRELKKYAHSFGLAFFVTPFDLKSAQMLDKIGMDAWKISSFDVNHKPLLECVAKRKQPVFLSIGMSTQQEADEAVSTVLKYNKQLIINHCVSIYPTPPEELNLGAVKTMIKRYSPLPIGYSGHEIGFIPTIVAVGLGVSTVERHVTLDKSLPGPDHATVSLDITELAEMVKQIRAIETVVRDEGLYLHEKEVPARNKHSKSVVSRIPIPAGTVITANCLTCKSPGHGIKPTLMHIVVGKKAKADIPADTVILKEYLI